jgi:Protein of unknown function (DUF2510)
MMTSANAPGWLPDPERDHQERYWSGTAWTDRRRPAGMGGTLGLPGHAPDLLRAMSAATEDIEAVEDRLSLLFDRTETDATDPGRSRGAPPSPGRAATVGRDVDTDHDANDDVAFANLDAALAAEEADDPDDAGNGTSKSKRRMFRRRAKGTTSRAG